MVTCGSCGHVVRDPDAFCGRCGTQISRARKARKVGLAKRVTPSGAAAPSGVARQIAAWRHESNWRQAGWVVGVGALALGCLIVLGARPVQQGSAVVKRPPPASVGAETAGSGSDAVGAAMAAAPAALAATRAQAMAGHWPSETSGENGGAPMKKAVAQHHKHRHHKHPIRDEARHRDRKKHHV